MAGLSSAAVISEREDDFAAKVTVWHQFRALFLKNATLQFRSIGTNICQLLTPVIFVMFAGLLQVIVNSILASNNVVIPGTSASFFPPNNPGRLMACSYDPASNAPHNAEECQHEIFNFFLEFPEWKQTLELIEKFLPSKLKNYTKELEKGLQNLSDVSFLPCQNALFDLPFYYIGKSKGVNLDLGNLTGGTVNGTNRTGFVGGMTPDSWLYQFSLDFKIQDNSSQVDNDTCPINDGPYVQLPMFIETDNLTALNDQLIDIVKDYNFHANKSSGTNDQYHRNYYVTPLSTYQYRTVMSYIQNIHNHSLGKIKPQSGIFVDNFQSSGSEVKLDYTIVADDLVLYSYELPEHTSVSGFKHKIDVEINRRNGIINMMSNALFKQLLGINQSSLGDNVTIATYIMPLPTQPMPITIDITSILGGLLYPFALSFLIPVFMSSLVKDKFEKHLIMMEQNGLGRLTYWTVSYLFNYMLYIPIAIEIVIISFAFQIRLFTQTDGVILLLMLVVWGHTVVVLGFFFSTFFNRPRAATFVGYLIVVASVVVASLLETLQVFPTDVTPFFLYMMYPIFAFCRLFQYLNMACLALQCYSIDTLAPQDGGGLSLVATALVYLAGSTILLMVLSVYLSFVLPSSYGVRKSPFFPIIAVYRWIKSLCIKCGLVGDRGKATYEIRATSEVSVDLEEVDEDVQAEEDTLRRGFPEDAPVVMYKLRKEYPSSIGQRPYVAVHSVSLAIQRNECFGLLGPNGAGKTTLISVLTGLYEPTSGQARIAGYNIATDINDIHGHMGVCPQFDIQHASLTAEEHLLFYARLKGVKRSREGVVVERALRQVNLWEARKRKSCQLSGGMRRRLSVAMATVGNPDILILDEPTTGLDPASRRQVWEVIETVKEGRSVILTTHAMEEADQLCTRIGIMNFGRLRCLGSESRLKKKFGTGYQLTFNCAPGRVGEVEGYIATHIPRALHLETYADSCSYKLDKGALKVSEVFQLLDSVKTQVGILDWGIKMTTLEDVFLNIVKNTEDDRIPPPGLHMPKWLPCQQCRRKTGSDTE